MPQTASNTLIELGSKLLKGVCESPRMEAEILLAKASKINRIDFYKQVFHIDRNQEKIFNQSIELRSNGMPMAYILGKKDFWSLTLHIDKNVLIPRPETEIIVEQVVNRFKGKDSLNILDIGTGSGCILLSILKELNFARGIGIDVSSKAIKTAELAFLGIITISACLLGLNEVIALFACGIIGLTIYAFKKSRNTLNSFLPISLFSGLSMKIGGIKILLIFLKIGAILYGSGYVLFAFLDAELVSTNLLSRQELMDAVAFGQFTPGPVLSTATFIGWQLNGLNGALLATLGIFLPSFLFVGLLNPLIPKMQKSKIFRAFLDAINVAAVSVIIVVCIQMAKETVGDWRMILIACLSIITVFVFNKLNSAFIVLFGAIAGYALSFL